MADMDDAYRRAEHFRDFLLSYIVARDSDKPFRIETRKTPSDEWKRIGKLPLYPGLKNQYRLVFEPREILVNEYRAEDGILTLGRHVYLDEIDAAACAGPDVLRQVRFVEVPEGA